MYFSDINNYIGSFYKNVELRLEHYRNELYGAKHCKNNKSGHFNEIIYLENQIKIMEKLLIDLKEYLEE